MALTGGILGGAFDPPHVGHVALARAAIGSFDLDAAARRTSSESPGHKESRLAREPRVAARRARRSRTSRVRRSSWSRTPGPSTCYAAQPFDDPIFLIGADEFVDFPTWKEPDRVLELARLGVATRPGFPRDQLDGRRAALAAARARRFSSSSSRSRSSSRDLRAPAARGEPLDGLVPRRSQTDLTPRALPRRSDRGTTDTLGRSRKDAEKPELARTSPPHRRSRQEKLATDVTILDMRPVCDYTDFFVIGHGPQRAPDEGDLRRRPRDAQAGGAAAAPLGRGRSARRPGSSPTTSTSSCTSSRPTRARTTGSRSSGATSPPSASKPPPAEPSRRQNGDSQREPLH